MFDFLKNKLKTFFQKEEKKLEEKLETAPVEQPVQTPVQIEEPVKQQEKPVVQKPVQPKPIEQPVSVPQTKQPTQLVQPIEEKRELVPKLSLLTRAKQLILRKATINENDVSALIEDLNLELLEADVAIQVADDVCADIKTRLVGKEITAREDIKKVTTQAVRESLLNALKQEHVDLASLVKAKQDKPFVILFLGPNGHGKSTTVGKVAYWLQKQNISVVISASDTFRAAAIEQIEKIAQNTNTTVVKQKYGSDPAAVAFDAIKHAKAKGIQAVLIDTAGRSELNVNLMEQMKKITRVTNPDFKIYIGEALAGNAAQEEAKKFNEAIGINGIIVTKTDCDVKGGSLLSMSKITSKPVLFIGLGQEPGDLKPFDPEWFVKNVLD